jgi:hypothetical protein
MQFVSVDDLLQWTRRALESRPMLDEPSVGDDGGEQGQMNLQMMDAAFVPMMTRGLKLLLSGRHGLSSYHPE